MILTNKPGILYRLFKAYLRFFYDRIYYRRTYSLQTDHIPVDGTPLLIVSNHQNCGHDPLGILFAIRDRKPAFIARADVFTYHPLLAKFLYANGMLPAYRIAYEGEAALNKNKEMLRHTGRELLNGRTVVMYPEAGHQDKHWLGAFSFGYTRLAFEAAALGNFRTEIFILPSCNHYADYFQLQEQMLVKFGTPISIKPYYELYKTKPRTAQREVNTLVRKQIEDLMLDIRDLDNYQAIDFVCKAVADRNALSGAEDLPGRLLSDRALVASLAQAQTNDGAAVREIYSDALTLQEGIREMKINNRLFDRPFTWGALAGRSLLLVLLLPVWLFSLWPNVLHLVAPALLQRRMTDKMFYGTFIYALSVLITIPVFYTLTFVLTWIYVNLWIALIYLVSLPFWGLFAWYYRKFFMETRQAWHYHIHRKTEKLQALKKIRTDLYNRLDELK
ncbi:MAG: 1-acyl-sn-glycerol-3-phosphate acyltransferase [Tannerella sp.]|nr:1-acyl-sn-glycerol-3-phosphate acyltransferase [Tannerella sp.]